MFGYLSKLVSFIYKSEFYNSRPNICCYYQIYQTIGKKITSITPSRGFSAEFATATTVLVCSKLGLPVSTSHTLVGSVIGVGLARGMAALNLRVIRSIVNSWIITIPAAAVLTVLIFLVLKAVAL